MNNQTILIKLKQRLDKLDSEDYGNIEPWMLVEAFNKAQMQWIRRQLEGINQKREGAEGSTRKIDDLQFILNTQPQSSLTDYGIYQAFPLPIDYFEFSRLSANAVAECCPPRMLTIWPSIEADRDINLKDTGKQPNFKWATTFMTISNSKVNIYTNKLFDIQDVTLTYYIYPKSIQVLGVWDLASDTQAVVDVSCEATDNVVELMIDEAVGIISGDLKDYQRQQDINQQNDKNN